MGDNANAAALATTNPYIAAIAAAAEPDTVSSRTGAVSTGDSLVFGSPQRRDQTGLYIAAGVISFLAFVLILKR